MESLKMIVSPEDEQATDFIQKLDNRWASLRSQLANDYLRNVSSQPKTLMDAFVLASITGAWS
jgi:hypothetical protein